MAMKESLSGISSELGKILQQLRDIESVQGRIGKSTGTYSRALAGAGAGGGGSIGGSGFSTPPPAPGSQSGGITPTASGGAAPGGEEGGSGLGRGIAAGVGALATAGFNFLPSSQDAVAYQSAFFRSSFMGQGGYKVDDLAKMRAMFGNRQTDPFGMITAANAATMSGMGMGTAHFGTVMRQTATTSMLFGQSNALAAQAQTSLYSGPTAGRLGNIGIFVSNLNTGDPRAFGDIIDQIWQRAYGSKNAEIPYESVMADLRGGYLGAWLRRNFSDNPGLYDQLYQAIVLKANSNAKTLDYSDLKGKGIGSMMSQAKGQTSAMGSGMGLGLSEENDPMYFAARGYGAQARAIEGSMSELTTAWRNSMTPLINATESYAETMEDGNNTLMNIVTSLKGYLQTIGGNPVYGPLLGGLGGLLGGALFRAKGGEGTSTSDSITARLSKGEYVINARAAQAIGKDGLNALNAIGQNFGSGYASPAKSFSKGGSTLDGWPVLDSGSDLLQSFSVGGKSVRLRKDYGPMLVKLLQEYVNDPVLAPITYLGGHEYRRAYNPGSGSYTGGWSNHAAGVAIDVDADDWGMPPGRNITPTEMSSIKRLLANNPGIEWGGYWTGSSRDAMHFEIRDPSVKAGAGAPLVGSPESGSPLSEGAAPAARGASPLMVSTSMGINAFGGKPNTFSLGGFTGGAKGLSLGLGAAFSWVGGSLFGTTARGGIASAAAAQRESTDPSSTTTGTAEEIVPPTGNVGSGSGPEWLYKYLVSKGLRGNTLHKAWVIGMRESSGNPNLQSKDKYGGSWTSAGSPHYDVGLFQINNRHLPTVQKRYGGDMRQMLDLEKNYDMTTYMSNNWNNLLAWALESDGQTFNWSMYNPVPSWAGASMANHRRLWGEYDKYNTQNYSEGAYRTHEGMAKIHEGEMVLPANVAERFREMMREAGGPRGTQGGNVNITLNIERASDAEAERFARKVKKILEQDNWESSVRTR